MGCIHTTIAPQAHHRRREARFIDEYWIYRARVSGSSARVARGQWPPTLIRSAGRDDALYSRFKVSPRTLCWWWCSPTTRFVYMYMYIIILCSARATKGERGEVKFTTSPWHKTRRIFTQAPPSFDPDNHFETFLLFREGEGRGLFCFPRAWSSVVLWLSN